MQLMCDREMDKSVSYIWDGNIQICIWVIQEVLSLGINIMLRGIQPFTIITRAL
jgi:hypothetical protein